uniref:Uncharacterized protein LOC114340658 n=1 Tax=Diabrotica virgifera virgifera TaxID=50390 RepID=A0A6P7GMM1_DIAVI
LCAGFEIFGDSCVIKFTVFITWPNFEYDLPTQSDHKLWKYWTGVTWFSEWKKSLIYAPISVIPFVWPHKLWLSYVAGGQLLTLAFFHLVLTFKSKKKKRRRKDNLLHTDGDSFESSKFEEVTECLDDGLPEPIPGSSHSISDSLVEQDTILEI